MPNNVSIKIDLTSGTLEVEAPHEDLTKVFEQISNILPQLRQSTQGIEPPATKQEYIAENKQEDGKDTHTPVAKAKPKRRSRGKRSSASDTTSSSKLGSAFYKNFEPFDLGIGDEKEIELLHFYESIQHKNNRDKVLSIIYKISKLLDRNITYDDIYMGLRLCKEQSPPQNMSDAVGKLIDENFVSKEEDGIRIKILGEDHIDALEKKE